VLVLTGVHALGTSERSSASRSPPAKDKAGWLACWRLLMTRGLLRGGARELEMPTRGSSLRSARPGSPGSACRTHYLAGSLGQGGGVESSPCVANPSAHHRRPARRHGGHSLSSNGSPGRWLRRRREVVGIFQGRASDICLVGALLIGETEEWGGEHRSMSARDPCQGPTGTVPRRRPRHGTRPPQRR
jgi:hypothetical protein